MDIYTYTQIHMCTHTDTHVYTHRFTCIYKDTHAYTHGYTCVHTDTLHIYTNTHAHTDTHAYTHRYTNATVQKLYKDCAILADVTIALPL